MDVPLWVWAATVAVILAMLAVDLLAHRTAHEVSVGEAAIWSAVWVGLGVAFGGVVWAGYGAQAGGIGVWYSQCDSASLRASVTEVLVEAIRRTPGPIATGYWERLGAAIESVFESAPLAERFALSSRFEA